MPKEVIYSRSEKFDLEISWDGEEGRDHEVQIGMATRRNEQSLAEALCPPPPETAAVRLESPELVAARKLEACEHYRGIYGQFDRASLNRTIRLLRKVRDHVYGRDE